MAVAAVVVARATVERAMKTTTAVRATATTGLVAIRSYDGNMIRRVAIIVGMLLLGAGITAALHILSRRCAALGTTEKARLLNFVRLKYDLPSNVEIGVVDAGPVSSSCFRRLVFASLSGRQFYVQLFASPDFRFLTSDLLDARPDQKEVAERRRRTAASLVEGSVADRGDSKAPVTLAVFSDFQCPYCARFTKTASELSVAEGDKLQIVYRYFPLSVHPWAQQAAEAAACAQRQNNAAFWSLHDFLFAHQKDISKESVAQYYGMGECCV